MIAQLHSVYSLNEPNDLHRHISVMDDFDSMVLCESISPKDYGRRPDIYSFSNSRNYRVAGHPIVNRIFRNIYRALRDNFYADAIKENKVSVIHAHFGQVGADIADLAKRLDIPLVVTFYGVDISRLVKEKRWIKAYQRMFEVKGRFIVLCEEAKARLERIGCPSKKIRVADCLNDLAPFAYKERKPGAHVKLLITARFVEKKGYPILFEAMSMLLTKGRDIRLTVIGYGNEAQKRTLSGHIQRFGLQERVKVIDTHRFFEGLQRERRHA